MRMFHSPVQDNQIMPTTDVFVGVIYWMNEASARPSDRCRVFAEPPNCIAMSPT